MSSIQEREAELAALQSAFDEYITSSRELEEELDAELAKMQSKLAESSVANAALSSQLESMSPQLFALETALCETKLVLETSQLCQREAELRSEEAESRLRESEASLSVLKEDADAAHEELAFKESELEETVMELEVERERFRVELQDLQLDLQTQQQTSLSMNNNAGDGQTSNGHDNNATTTTVVDEDGFLAQEEEQKKADEDDDYVKRLEDELELVTEQLIDTEQRLTTAEDAMIGLKEAALQYAVVETLTKAQAEELEKANEVQNVLNDVLKTTREELDLAQEELVLVQEELKASQEDLTAQQDLMVEKETIQKTVVAGVRQLLEESQAECRTSANTLSELELTFTKSVKDSDQQAKEVVSLEQALENSKADLAALQTELETLEEKFDALQAEKGEADDAEQVANKEIKTQLESLKTEMAEEIETLKRQVVNLTENKTLLEQEHLDLTESKTLLQQQHADLKESKALLQQQLDQVELTAVSATGEQSEAVQKIQDQLMRAREAEKVQATEFEDLQQVLTQIQEQLQKSKEAERIKKEEVADLQQIVQSRVTKAEQDVARLEKELAQTKGNLYEAEAHLIVLSKKQKTIVAVNGNEDSTARGRSASNGDDHNKHARSASPDSPQKLRLRVSEEETKSSALATELAELKEQARMEEKHKKHLEEELKTLQEQLFAGDAPVVQQMSRLSQLSGPSTSTAFGEEVNSPVEEVIKSNNMPAMAEELRAIEKRSNRQRDYNAQLLSKILSLQGNIQVCCRVRPLRLQEIKAGAKNNVEALSETELGCFDNRHSKWKPFAFDKVWGPDQTQKSIFQDVEPLALSVVDGFNACIFAYGQTGSGKTFTMEGTAEGNNYGISYRTIQKLFSLLSLRAQQQKAASNLSGESKAFSFKLQLGMLEIYNDEIFDLLAPHNQAGSKADQKRQAKDAGVKATLDIRRSADGRVEVPDLSKKPVKSIEDVMSLLKLGNSVRSTASTNLNEHSSRSHMVLSVDVESGLEGEPANKGILYLVDLAGSERVGKSLVEGAQLKEASHINKSLSALGNVMEALDRKASHVPYRDSKLTYLLQDAVGGNSRTMMVVTVCPTDSSHDESVHALQFATRVRRIQIGAAQRNVTSKNLEETVKSLTAEMKKLSKSKENSESQLSTLKKDNTRIQERLQTISTQKQKSQSDNSNVEVLKKSNNDMTARWNKEKTLRETKSEELEKSKAELRKKQGEVAKLNREKESLARKLEEKDKTLHKAVQDARQAKDASSAANLRARKAQVIGSRHTTASRATIATTPVKVTTTPKNDVDLAQVRAEVLELLEKYDKAKVDRIDIIMDKFKGKEELLVEKMKQRYEAPTLQRRSEMALQRHKDRMQKRLDEQKLGK